MTEQNEKRAWDGVQEKGETIITSDSTQSEKTMTDETYFSAEKDMERASRLWARPEFSSREIDIQFTKAIANEIWTARQNEYQNGFSNGKTDAVKQILGFIEYIIKSMGDTR